MTGIRNRMGARYRIHADIGGALCCLSVDGFFYECELWQPQQRVHLFESATDAIRHWNTRDDDARPIHARVVGPQGGETSMTTGQPYVARAHRPPLHRVDSSTRGW